MNFSRTCLAAKGFIRSPQYELTHNPGHVFPLINELHVDWIVVMFLMRFVVFVCSVLVAEEHRESDTVNSWGDFSVDEE
tara:strand:- start:125 stop:361 length:237 start_codon:yes stop_codon:yes gene_type:complete